MSGYSEQSRGGSDEVGGFSCDPHQAFQPHGDLRAVREILQNKTKKLAPACPEFRPVWPGVGANPCAVESARAA